MTTTTKGKPQPGMPVRFGDLVGEKYLIGDLLASGGMGLVFAAIHVDLEKPVALKCVRSQLAENSEMVARFLNEARAAARLRNEHVAHVLDFGRTDAGAPYLVMERLEGADLRTLLDEKGPFPVQEAVDYVIQACSALAEAHAQGIVHRDIKPENLFLTSAVDGKPLIKVLDFGISKQLSAKVGRGLTNPTQSMGSPYYMSPEQIRNARLVDARTDVWSIGVVLFELLTGELPFDAELMTEVCGRVLCDPPRELGDVRPDLPRELEAILSRCFEKQRERRFGDVAAFARALEPFASPAGRASIPSIERITTGSEISKGEIRVASSNPPSEPTDPRAGLTAVTISASRRTTRIPGQRRFWPAVLLAAAGLTAAAFGSARHFGYDVVRPARGLLIEPKLADELIGPVTIAPKLELLPCMPILNDAFSEPEIESAPEPLVVKRVRHRGASSHAVPAGDPANESGATSDDSLSRDP